MEKAFIRERKPPGVRAWPNWKLFLAFISLQTSFLMYSLNKLKEGYKATLQLVFDYFP